MYRYYSAFLSAGHPPTHIVHRVLSSIQVFGPNTPYIVHRVLSNIQLFGPNTPHIAHRVLSSIQQFGPNTPNIVHHVLFSIQPFGLNTPQKVHNTVYYLSLNGFQPIPPYNVADTVYCPALIGIYYTPYFILCLLKIFGLPFGGFAPPPPFFVQFWSTSCSFYLSTTSLEMAERKN